MNVHEELAGIQENNERLLSLIKIVRVEGVKEEIYGILKDSDIKAYLIVTELLQQQLDQIHGTYWAAGSDLVPCKTMGGTWNFVSLDYETERYKRLYHKQFNDDKKDAVIRAGFHPVSWDIRSLQLPPEIPDSSQNVSLVRGPGMHYLDFKQGLWHCATESLCKGGILISDLGWVEELDKGELPERCRANYLRLTDLLGIPGLNRIELIAITGSTESARARLYPIRLYKKN